MKLLNIKVDLLALLVIGISHNQIYAENSCQPFSDNVHQYYRVFNNSQYFPQSQIQSKEKAYLVQACILENKRDEIIGFKAGLTNKAAQKRYYSYEPVMGVLVEDNIKEIRETIYVENKVAFIEAELAFRLKRNIDDLEDLDKAIADLVDAVAPAIEVPLFHFEKANTLKANDIIAANVGAYRVILGTFVMLGDIDINSVKISITKEEKVVVNSIDVKAQDRWEALRWLIKKSYLEGYDLNKGTIYLTGSVVSPAIANKANYRISFSQLEDILLAVE